MGKVRSIEPVKLIVGMIGKREEHFGEALEMLTPQYGPVDFSSDFIPFTFTSYYEREMGTGLLRRFFAFRRLVLPSVLPGVKLSAIGIEERFSLPGEGGGMKRQINIDPGYIGLSKLVLASTKDRSHRIYIGEGIYAEVTLQFEKRTFRPWHWTYPDYRSPGYIGIFNAIRLTLCEQLTEAEGDAKERAQ
ncbi:MAG: DUF4416 family protein [Candidatus Eremiobacteraeota bacterium]|nr:DUF4416 family protein [Candidatus Eremiobacteraeota bacterium]